MTREDGLKKRMGNAHEDFVCDELGLTKSRGSGNQWRNPMDGRESRYDHGDAIAVDCKSTMGKSIGVSRDMWQKAKEQSQGQTPAIPLRFYDTERLAVGLDLIVVPLDHYKDLRERVRGIQ